ncbi:MAG: PA0069 family radical SAM protein [Candidatus Binatia bacterium]|nr:PA0069 family radical SAM protein [Candidatus Binatia bacterium]
MPRKGRGTFDNPPNRFERLVYQAEPCDEAAEERISPYTRLLRDPTRTILARNQSPDVGFTVSINPYRGCEHGCIYCYARPTHEWLGFSAGLDFETQILVKEEAPRLLQAALASPSWRPQPIALSGVTDPYQPAERSLRLTRRCLEVIVAWRNPVAIVTKSALVTRDIDLLTHLARVQAAAVFLSLTTLDPRLARLMEPRASSPTRRLEAIQQLHQAGIPTGVMVAPLIPGLTDHEMPAILRAAARAGARFAGHTIVRLPYGVGDLFSRWLAIHYPHRRNTVLNHLRAIRRGKLNDARWYTRMRGEGVLAESLHALFALLCRRTGLSPHGPQLSTAAFRPPASMDQLPLF